MTVSVIIPAYNASTTLGPALEALSHQETRNPFEIIVVDDGSSDDTSIVVRRFPQARYVYQDNAGPAAARNHGARLAQGQYLCFTDADCIPHADWISALLRGFHGPGIAVVCGSYGIANPQSLLARGIHAEIRFRHLHVMPDVPKAFGSYNFCVRKNIFKQIGGFYEGYHQASGEDNDLSYKILKAGYRIYFERQALVDHYHTSDVGKYLKEQFRHGFWRVQLYARHPAMARGDGYTFWKDILELPWSGACLLLLVLNLLGAGGFKAAAYCFFFYFLIFESLCAFWMLRGFFEGIFFAFVMFLRAFARTLGFSTGIFYFFIKSIEKIFK